MDIGKEDEAITVKPVQLPAPLRKKIIEPCPVKTPEPIKEPSKEPVKV